MLSLNWLCILNSKPECEFEFKIKIQMEGKLKMEKNKKIKKKKGGNGCHAWTESPSPRPTSSLLLGAGPSNRCRCCVDPVCKSPAHVSDVLSLGGPPAIHTVGWESSIWFTGRPSPRVYRPSRSLWIFPDDPILRKLRHGSRSSVQPPPSFGSSGATSRDVSLTTLALRGRFHS
jgi:hypothetical protein